MRARNTLVLLVLAVIALGAAWQFGLRSVPAERTEVAPGTLVFPGLAAELPKVAGIEILHAGQTLKLGPIPGAAGKWGLSDRNFFPVQADKLRELLTGLTELRITEARTADSAEYARLGVEEPAAPASNSNLIRLLDAGGKPVAELIVGHRRMRTQGNLPEAIYIRRPGEAQSWLAEGRLPVDADPQLWFERDIANIDHGKIAKVTVRRGDSTLEFALVDGKLAMTGPADHPKLDEYRLEEIGRSLEMLTLSDVKPVAEQPGDKLGTCTIVTTDGTTLTITVFKHDKDIWAQFAAAGDSKEAKDLQARVAGWTYQVGSWKEQSFVPTMDDLKETPPAPAPNDKPASQ
jgi:hypothetical protein